MLILDLLLSLLYPPRCAGCRRELRRTPPYGLCRGCVAALGVIGCACTRCGEPGVTGSCAACRKEPPAFRRAMACFLYVEDAPSSDLVARWKFHGDHVVGAGLARLLAAHRRRRPECYDVVVPVPLHRSRLASRGFNQAAVLARAARRPGERLAVDALERISPTAHQLALGRRARAGNVQRVFAVRDAAAVRGRSVLLIDDVLTSGATVGTCAEALLAAGAALVEVWTLARTPRPAYRTAAGRRASIVAAGAS